MPKTKFYTAEDISTWDRVKKAFANDWEQTKADFGVSGNRDMDQDVDDTFRQIFDADEQFENREQAYRFGYAAARHYRSQYPQWNDELETQIRDEYEGDYDIDRDHIRYAYGYKG